MTLIIIIFCMFFDSLEDRTMMESSVCHRVLEQHSDEIQRDIQTELTWLVDKLVDEGVVEVQIRNRVFEDPATVSDTARNTRLLLTVIKGKVRENPAHFNTFVQVLKESSLTELAWKLETARGRLCSQVQHLHYNNGFVIDECCSSLGKHLLGNKYLPS